VPAKRAAGGRGRQTKNKNPKDSFDAPRESVKLLLFAQAVLYLASGALPGPLRILTLLPGVILLGVGAFRLLGILLTYLHAQKIAAPPARVTAAARPQPAPAPQVVPARVASTRVA
jgi:hypothetical protein